MDDDHRSVDESCSVALQRSDEAPIDGHPKSKCAKSTEDFPFYHLSWPS